VSHVSNQMANRSRLMAALAAGEQVQVRQGLVNAYDPNTQTVKVLILPEGLETGWVQLTQPWIGDGWGCAFGPELGTEAIIMFDNGSMNSGIALCGQWSTEEEVLPVPSGEAWIVHKSESLLKFTNDGNVTVTSHQDMLLTAGRDMTAVVHRNLNATVSGTTTLTSEGDITVNAEADTVLNVTGDVTATIGGSVAATIAGNASWTCPLTTITGDMTVNGLLTTAGFAAVGGFGHTAASISIPLNSTSDIHATGTVTGVTDVVA